MHAAVGVDYNYNRTFPPLVVVGGNDHYTLHHRTFYHHKVPHHHGYIITRSIIVVGRNITVRLSHGPAWLFLLVTVGIHVDDIPARFDTDPHSFAIIMTYAGRCCCIAALIVGYLLTLHHTAPCYDVIHHDTGAAASLH